MTVLTHQQRTTPRSMLVRRLGNAGEQSQLNAADRLR